MVVISACYSGVFVPILAGSNRMVLTAARPDRTSFGCGEADRYPYFDQCVLESMPAAPDFAALGRAAQRCVATREQAETADPALRAADGGGRRDAADPAADGLQQALEPRALTSSGDGQHASRCGAPTGAPRSPGAGLRRPGPAPSPASRPAPSAPPTPELSPVQSIGHQVLPVAEPAGIEAAGVGDRRRPASMARQRVRSLGPAPNWPGWR